MIMNKKIFTLVVGAGILISSLFTVNAQAVLPYSPKPAGDITTVGQAYFNDILTADIVEYLGQDYKDHKYVLSVTGLANPSNDPVALAFAALLGNQPNGPGQQTIINSRDFSMVLYVDSWYRNWLGTGTADKDKLYTEGEANLRLENLADLDIAGYEFESYKGGQFFNSSKKLEAIRRASWCVSYQQAAVKIGSNVVFDFVNTATGLKLATKDFTPNTNWNYPEAPLHNNAYYNSPIDIAGRDKMYNWRFSQTVSPNQPLQQGMSLYAYSKADTVVVLVLNTDFPYIDPLTTPDKDTGGFTVSIKHVSVNDLILDATGAVKLVSPTNPKVVENVLLFTLKKVNQFVMNANDWNAVSLNQTPSTNFQPKIAFSPTADLDTKSFNYQNTTYRNPFTDFKLQAYEVNDPLYHYGYMNFKATVDGINDNSNTSKSRNVNNMFMYIDTAFVNDGQNQYLAFAFDRARKDNTETGAAVLDEIVNTTATNVGGIYDVNLWGSSFTPQLLSKSCVKLNNGVLSKDPYMKAGCNYGEGYYWRMDSIFWALMYDALLQIRDYWNNEPNDPNGNPNPNYGNNPQWGFNDLFTYEDNGTDGPTLRYIGWTTPIDWINTNSLRIKYNEIYAEYVSLSDAVEWFDFDGTGINPVNGYGLPWDIMSGLPSGLPPAGFSWPLTQDQWVADPFHYYGSSTAGTGFLQGVHFTPYDLEELDDNGIPEFLAERALYESYLDSYKTDSLNFIYAYMKDSIMENQSKFRAVYDPFADSTYINVYQSRVRHPNTEIENNPSWPAWWTNSFGEYITAAADLIGPDGTAIPIGSSVIYRPSDIFTNALYGNVTWNHTLFATPPNYLSISEAANYYYNSVILPMYALNGNLSDKASPYTLANFTNVWGVIEGHGVNLNGQVSSAGFPQSLFNFHSFMEWYPKSDYSKMDKVMISTADTARIYEDYYTNLDQGALSHMYGWSLNSNDEAIYKDSLLYIDIYRLNGNILTLDQSIKANGQKGIDTKISLDYGMTCQHAEDAFNPQPDRIAWIPDDLYLIRNLKGEYLCVPLWSIQDSVYWVTPKEGENPTKMPCYQWAIVNEDNTPDLGSRFTLANREFEKVRWDGLYFAYPGTATGVRSHFLGVTGGSAYPSDNIDITQFNMGDDNRVYVHVITNAIGFWNGFGGRFTPKLFSTDVKQNYGFQDGYSFFGLASEVKKDYLLGYHYVTPNDAFKNVYAFKYLNNLSLENPRFINWINEETEGADSALYVRGQSYWDRLYFGLEEMNGENITNLVNNVDGLGQGIVRLNRMTSSTHPLRKLYDDFNKNDYLNADSLVLERYGFYTLKTTDGGQNTANPEIKDLVPLARQAYNLFLKDNYRWHPTVLGHYMTVGQVDKYILADKLHARQDYLPSGPGEPNKVEGLFGVPYFYFRNSMFDIEKPLDDYFAMIQRLDTFGTLYGFNYNFAPVLGSGPGYENLEEFMIKRFGSEAASKVMVQIKRNKEFGVFIVQVQDAYTPLTLNIRGDGAERISTFQLVTDEDPVYRRFHENEPDFQFGDPGDYPDFMEFRLHNDLVDLGRHLYENFGNYSDLEDPDSKDGWSGGRDENVDKAGNFMKDSLDNVISFLGMNYKAQYGEHTKYGIFVDTAFIKRGSGWVKPQYLLAVDPYFPKQEYCDPATGELKVKNERVILARYMYNTAQLAKEVDRTQDKGANWPILYPNQLYTNPKTLAAQAFEIRNVNYNKVEPINPEKVRRDFPFGAPYLWAEKHERIAFAWAIHLRDELIVLKNIPMNYEGGAEAIWKLLVAQYGHADNIKYEGSTLMDWTRLYLENIDEDSEYDEFYYPNGDRTTTASQEIEQGAIPVEIRTYFDYVDRKGQVDLAGRPVAGLHAIIRLDDNTHKDWVWSMRYIQRGSSDFVIESETTERMTKYGAMILPGYGGWLKFENSVPVISRTDAVEVMADSYGAVFNVKQVSADQAVNNEKVAATSDIKVIGGAGTVTVLNAAGKNVVISNVLGQTLVNTTLKSDNVTLAVPAGIAVVSVETAKAAKVLVK